MKVITVSFSVHPNVPDIFGLIEKAQSTESVFIVSSNVIVIVVLTGMSVPTGVVDTTLGGIFSTLIVRSLKESAGAALALLTNNPTINTTKTNAIPLPDFLAIFTPS